MTGPNLRTAGVVNVEFGRGAPVVEPADIYGRRIGDDVFIDPFVEIQKDVPIGARSRIQSHAFIFDLVEIGEDCFVSNGTMFVNDLFAIGGRAWGNKSLWKSTRVGDQISIGPNATILPVRICDDVVVGAGSEVTKDITEPGIYAGNPAKKLRDAQ